MAWVVCLYRVKNCYIFVTLMDDIENVRTEDIMRKIQCNPMFNIVLQLDCIITITSGRGGGGEQLMYTVKV